MSSQSPYSARPTRRSVKADVAGDKVQGQAGFDMANLRPETTGLPFVGKDVPEVVSVVQYVKAIVPCCATGTPAPAHTIAPIVEI